ncbi:6615_t:CDS:2, partial [Acaulospora morrowiae]
KVLHPEVLWAQRANELYITISLTDVKDPKINVTKDKLSFEGVGGTEQKLYGFELELHKEINPEFLVDLSNLTRFDNLIQCILDFKTLTDCAFHLHCPLQSGEWLLATFAERESSAPDPLGGMDFSNLMGGDSGQNNPLDVSLSSCIMLLITI